MIPPVPKETLPQWVQDLLDTRPQTFEVGDRVYGVLYGEEDGVVLRVDNYMGSIGVGRQWNEERQEYDQQTSAGTRYYVKYPDTEEERP